jgi:hypothetical protein
MQRHATGATRTDRNASPINSRLNSGKSHEFGSSVVRRVTGFVSKSLIMLECQSQQFRFRA